MSERAGVSLAIVPGQVATIWEGKLDPCLASHVKIELHELKKKKKTNPRNLEETKHLSMESNQ